ncbi:MAG: hypothetical protein ACTHJ4_01430 [Candidatus Nucleicultricaceae bacterium]
MSLFNKSIILVVALGFLSAGASASNVEEECTTNAVRIRAYPEGPLSSRNKKFVSIHCFGGDGSADEAYKMLKEYGTSIHYFIPADQPQDDESPEVVQFVDPSKVAFSIGPAVWCINNGSILFSTFLADTISIGVGTKGYSIDHPDDFKKANALQIKVLSELVKPYLQQGCQIIGHGEVSTNPLFRGPGTHVWKALSAGILAMIKEEDLVQNNSKPIDFPHIIEEKVEKRVWKKEGDSSLEEDLRSDLPALLRKIGYAVADMGSAGDKGLRKPFEDAVQQFNNRYRPDLPVEQWRVIDESLADAVYFVAHKVYLDSTQKIQ